MLSVEEFKRRRKKAPRYTVSAYLCPGLLFTATKLLKIDGNSAFIIEYALYFLIMKKREENNIYDDFADDLFYS